MSVKQRFIFCKDCDHLIRIDDGSYCIHYRAPERNTESVTVVFRGPNGETSIPWEPTAKCPPGYQREEIRGSRAVRKLERELDRKDLQRYRETQERKQMLIEPRLQHHRENLKQIVREARNPFERHLAQAALDRSQRGYSTNYDPGNHRE